MEILPVKTGCNGLFVDCVSGALGISSALDVLRIFDELRGLCVFRGFSVLRSLCAFRGFDVLRGLNIHDSAKTYQPAFPECDGARG